MQSGSGCCLALHAFDDRRGFLGYYASSCSNSLFSLGLIAPSAVTRSDGAVWRRMRLAYWGFKRMLLGIAHLPTGRHWLAGLVGVAAVMATASTARASDVQSAQIAGGVEAVIYICTSIDIKSSKTGIELLKTVVVEKKIDLVAARKTDSYRSIYNSEVNRMLSMAPKDRLTACQTAW